MIWRIFIGIAHRNSKCVLNLFSMLRKTSKTIALCSLANFINAADRIVMPIAIIPMTDQYNWSLYWQGWILSAFAFGYITSQVCLRFYCCYINLCNPNQNFIRCFMFKNILKSVVQIGFLFIFFAQYFD